VQERGMFGTIRGTFVQKLKIMFQKYFFAKKRVP